MNRKQTLVILTAVLYILSALSGCTSVAEDDSSTILSNISSGSELYEQAISKLESSDNFGISVNIHRIIETEQQTITEDIQSEYSFEGFGTADLRLSIEESIIYPGGTIAISQIYENGTAYMDLAGSHFTAKTDYASFINDRIPVKLLNPSLYGSIQAKENSGRILIGFSEPLAAERWGFSKEMQLLNASGSIILTGDGTLIQSNYTAQCTTDNTKITMFVTTKPLSNTNLIELPRLPENYTPVDDISAPIILEKCSNLLLNAQHISSRTQHIISSQASNLTREQITELTHHFNDDGYQASVNTQVELTDSTRSGGVTSTRQIETFHAGRYTTEADDTVTEDPAITADIMQDYCKNLLVSTIPLLTYVEDAKITKTGSNITYTFTATEELAKLIRTSACQTLYQDPTVLDTLASDYETKTIVCSLYVSTRTGLPVTSSIIYEGVHTIEDKNYTLASETIQSYSFD